MNSVIPAATLLAAALITGCAGQSVLSQQEPTEQCAAGSYMVCEGGTPSRIKRPTDKHQRCHCGRLAKHGIVRG